LESVLVLLGRIKNISLDLRDAKLGGNPPRYPKRIGWEEVRRRTVVYIVADVGTLVTLDQALKQGVKGL
jgi:hypothetical protein